TAEQLEATVKAGEPDAAPIAAALDPDNPMHRAAFFRALGDGLGPPAPMIEKLSKSTLEPTGPELASVAKAYAQPSKGFLDQIWSRRAAMLDLFAKAKDREAAKAVL